MFIDNYLCVNAHHSCYNNLIRKEMKNTEKENNESIESLKSQITQLQNLSINNNQVTAEIRKKMDRNFNFKQQNGNFKRRIKKYQR